METIFIVVLLKKVVSVVLTIVLDPILFGLVAFFFTAVLLLVVSVRYVIRNQSDTASISTNTAHTGKPDWHDGMSRQTGGMDVNPVSVLRIMRNARLGLSGVGAVSMTDSGVVQRVSARLDLGSIHLEGSGISPLDLGIGDLECYLERHAHQNSNDLGVWLPSDSNSTDNRRYVSLFELGHALPESMSKARRIYRMWMVTRINAESSNSTTVYVPFVPFRVGSVSMDTNVYARVSDRSINAGDYLDLHARGEWGDCKAVDAIRNEFAAIVSRGEIRSCHWLDDSDACTALQIVTAEDHSSTYISLIDGASVH